MDKPQPSRATRKRALIDRLIRIKKHKIIVFAAMILAAMAVIGAAAEGLSHVIALYREAFKDAKGITEIAQRVEGQAATIDLVARKATEVEALATKASKSVSELEGLAEFTSTVSAAQTDDRKAFDRLEEWMAVPTYRYRDRAELAWVSVLDQHDQGITKAYEVSWAPGVDPAKLTLADLIKAYDAARAPAEKMALIQFFAKRADISKAERLAFYVGVMKKEQSLNVLETAGRGFTQVADLKIKPLAVKYLLQWWEDNKDKLK